MSALPDNPDDATLYDLMEMTAEELEKRGLKLLKLSRDLLRQAQHHANLSGLPAQRSLGRSGNVVDENVAIVAARELGEHFTHAQYGERLGLKPAATMRWLAMLIQREHPVITHHPEGDYSYLQPPASRLPERKPTPEQQLIDKSVTPARGTAVRVVKPRKRARSLSVAGQGNVIRQRDKRREAQEAVAAERARKRRKS